MGCDAEPKCEGHQRDHEERILNHRIVTEQVCRSNTDCANGKDETRNASEGALEGKAATLLLALR